MQTMTHGTVSCRVEHVPGSREAPLSRVEMMEKLSDCLSRGVRPLTAKKIETLSARVNDIEHVSDMASFFEGIC
jgi:hypothetical protein